MCNISWAEHQYMNAPICFWMRTTLAPLMHIIWQWVDVIVFRLSVPGRDIWSEDQFIRIGVCSTSSRSMCISNTCFRDKCILSGSWAGRSTPRYHVWFMSQNNIDIRKYVNVTSRWQIWNNGSTVALKTCILSGNNICRQMDTKM